MGLIATNIDIHNKLTVKTANGTILYENIMNSATDYYSGTVVKAWGYSMSHKSRGTKKL